MRLNRRDALLASLPVAALAGLAGPAGAEAGPDAAAWARLAPHPRLLAPDAELHATWQRRDPVSRALRARITAQADAGLAAPPVAYTDRGSFLVGDMREVQGRLIALGFVWRATGERRYLDAARRELAALVALPSWGPGHFLGVGEAALAAAIALDWLHAPLSDAERQATRRALVELALKPSLAAPPGSWVDATYNWNPVCHAGLVAAALVVAEAEPALARQIVARAVAHLPKATAAYEPDGVFPEGPSYWSYGTSFHILLTECLRTALGSAFGLDQAPGFLRSADALAQTVGPSGQDFNFSDYHPRPPSEPALFWFARQLGRREVAAPELRWLARPHAPGEAAPSRHLALGLIWWQPNLPADRTPPPRLWVGGGPVPVAALRSAWGDPNALFVALKGGSPDHSHGHMDIGGFVLEADGVRWAVELPAESYPRMRAAGIDLWNYRQASSRWRTFRVGPEAHNILRFNGLQQQVTGRATIRNDSTPHLPSVVLNLTPTYQGQMAQVQRRLSLLPGPVLLLQDDWRAGDQATAVAWQWLTFADATVRGAQVLLRQAGRTLRLRFESDLPMQIEVQDVSAAAAPQDADNPGLRRLVVRLSTAAGSAGGLRVTVAPGAG